MLWAFHCSAQLKHEHIKCSLTTNHIKSSWSLVPGKTTTDDMFNWTDGYLPDSVARMQTQIHLQWATGSLSK